MECCDKLIKYVDRKKPWDYTLVFVKEDAKFERFYKAVGQNPLAINRAYEKYSKDLEKINAEVLKRESERNIDFTELCPIAESLKSNIVPNMNVIGEVVERIKMNDFGYDERNVAKRLRTINTAVIKIRKKLSC